MPTWNPHATYVVTEEYRYSVELNRNRSIVGGSYKSWDRPDFAWVQKSSDFHGFFGPLNSIYAASTNSTPMSTRAVPPRQFLLLLLSIDLNILNHSALGE